MESVRNLEKKQKFDFFILKSVFSKFFYVPLKTEQKIEKESTSKAVEDDRKLEIQCCIVRVMKARKKLDHNGLITETIEQLKHRFRPKVPMIKKGIDMLIEKEYINRSEDDNGTYAL